MLAKVETPNRNYEGVIILHPDVNETEQKNFFKKNAETIKAFKGRVNHLDTWGKRKLANPIKKMRLGTYFHVTFEAQPECVTELERIMKIDDRVLRFSHLRLDDRVSLASHVDKFKNTIVESNKREQEREAKRDLRRREGGGPRGPRRNESRPGGRFGNPNRDDDMGGDIDMDSESGE
jgi:small subunit ribosomal protein S6